MSIVGKYSLSYLRQTGGHSFLLSHQLQTHDRTRCQTVTEVREVDDSTTASQANYRRIQSTSVFVCLKRPQDEIFLLFQQSIHEKFLIPGGRLCSNPASEATPPPLAPRIKPHGSAGSHTSCYKSVHPPSHVVSSETAARPLDPARGERSKATGPHTRANTHHTRRAFPRPSRYPPHSPTPLQQI